MAKKDENTLLPAIVAEQRLTERIRKTACGWYTIVNTFSTETAQIFWQKLELITICIQ